MNVKKGKMCKCEIMCVCLWGWGCLWCVRLWCVSVCVVCMGACGVHVRVGALVVGVSVLLV